MSLSPGARLGVYEIVSLLGSGGMGEVYRARDTKLGRDVALKTLPETFTDDPDRVARFRREAQVLAALNHPHIGAIYGLEEISPTGAGAEVARPATDLGRPADLARPVTFLVLELVDGQTLGDRIARGPLPLDEALPIAREIAEALDAAHQKGIIHRDLKPANIAVTNDGHVKVLDFGLAKALDDGSGSQPDMTASPTMTTPAMLTGVGVILGTAAYMAPEQAKGRLADKRSDVWAFGCVLYEMLIGKRAFAGEDVSETLAAVLRAEPDWSALPADVPPPIRRLLRRCLEKDRKRRLADTADARLEIEDAIASPRAEQIASAEPPRRKGLGLTAGAAVALVALAAGGAGGWLLRHPDTPLRPPTRFAIAASGSASVNPVGPSSNFAVSPDGRHVVFLVLPGRRIHVRSLDQFEGTTLDGTENANQPFFSPDGDWIGFIVGSTLRKIRATGGTTLTIGEATGWTNTPAWRSDDSVVFAAGTGGLMRIPASGGRAQRLLEVANGESCQSAYSVLGSDVLLYTISTSSGTTTGRVMAMNVKTGVHAVVAEQGGRPHYVSSGHVVYADGDSLLAAPFDLDTLSLSGRPVRLVEGLARIGTGVGWFGVSPTGTLAYVSGVASDPRSLVWVDRRGAEVEKVATPPRMFEQPRLSPDGRRLAISTRETNAQDVWVLDLARAGAMTRLSFSPDEEETPVWAPDGRRIFFRAAGRVPSWKPSDGSGAEQPIPGAQELAKINTHLVSVSPDGKFLAGYSTTTGEDILIASLEGAPSVRPFVQTPFQEVSPVFSPDGKWIAYASDESGRFEVYVQAFPGPGGKWQVSSGGGTEPMWDRDGKELFYRNERRMMAAPVQTSPTFTPGAPQLLFEADYEVGHRNHPNYDVSLDGRRFLMIKNERGASNSRVQIVTDWGTELRQRAPRH